MVATTRMAKYKWLHDQVNRDINKFSILDNENQQFSRLIEKLDLVDRTFFRDKLAQFLHEQQLEKPYLETVRDNVTITENEVSELKRILTELKNVHTTNQAEEVASDDNDAVFNQTNQQYKDKLDATLSWLNESVERYNAKTVKHHPIIESVSMSLVQQIRNRDERQINELARDLDVINKEIDAKRLSLRNKIRRTKQMRSLKVVLPILIIALVLIAIGIALVLVL
jgi:hypothetical protein